MATQDLNSINTVSETSSTSFDTFHPFQRLPSEIRRLIWQLAASEPRKVEFYPYYADDPAYRCLSLYGPRTQDFIGWGPFSTTTSPPAILHVCSESRAEATKYHYVPAFQRSEDTRYYWVNFAADTILIPHQDIGLISVNDRRKIQRAEINGFELSLLPEFEPWADLQALQHLVFVVPKNLEKWKQRFKKVEENFENWFGDVDGWVLPTIEVIQRPTNWEVLRSRQRLKYDQCY